jgi:TetR/AcrR family transcriptional repressor of uid operon
MPKLSEEKQAERRHRILDAAERCFARRGFHAATMQDIRTEAGVSAGALYLYFPSKEAMIAGIAERDRREISEGFAAVAAAPDLISGLEELGRHMMVERPEYKCMLMVEINAEAMRNPAIAAVCQAIEDDVVGALAGLFEAGKKTGEVVPDLDSRAAAMTLTTFGDGFFLRKATDPRFDPGHAYAVMMRIVRALVKGELALPSALTATRELAPSDAS